MMGPASPIYTRQKTKQYTSFAKIYVDSMKLILHVDNLRNNRTLTNMRGENPRKSRIAAAAPQSERIYIYIYTYRMYQHNRRQREKKIRRILHELHRAKTGNGRSK